MSAMMSESSDIRRHSMEALMVLNVIMLIGFFIEYF